MGAGCSSNSSAGVTGHNSLTSLEGKTAASDVTYTQIANRNPPSLNSSNQKPGNKSDNHHQDSRTHSPERGDESRRKPHENVPPVTVKHSEKQAPVESSGTGTDQPGVERSRQVSKKPPKQSSKTMSWLDVLYQVADKEQLWGDSKREDRPKWQRYLDKAEEIVRRPRKDLPADVVKAVIEGDMSHVDLASIPSAQPKMVVFVSSTFTDTKAERNHLMMDVYPFLRTLCRRLGVDFGTVDMRWGVTEEATLEHSTVAMCVREIQRCVTDSAGPAFLCILGQKYGYRPLPAEIEQKEYETLLACLEAKQDTTMLQSYYRLDINAEPAEYVLKPQSKEDTAWWDNMEFMQNQLREASIDCFGKDFKKTDKYHISVTETEIWNGVFNNSKADEQVLFMERNLKDLTVEPHLNRKLIDMKETEIDDYAQGKLGELRNTKIPGYTTDSLRLKVDYTESDVEDCKERIRAACDDICEHLAEKIVGGYDRNLHMKSDPIFREALEHRKILLDKCSLFVGREEHLGKITSYTNSKKHSTTPLVVHGESGCGKTALVAMAAKMAKEAMPQAVMVVRFLGTTSHSGSARNLLTSICRQITRVFKQDLSLIPQSYKELTIHLRKCLGYATSDKPIILFLDSLDQLSNEDFAHNLSWLSLGEELPEHVKVVVSTLPMRCLEVLNSFLPPETMVEVQRLKNEEGPDILKKMLLQQGRRLTPEQESIVIDKFTGCPLPLFLRLAADLALKWHSYDDVVEDDIATDMPGLVTMLFERLESRYGALFVHHALGYITSAKFGLSVAELEDILSCDDPVLDSIFEWWTPPFRRIPQLLWARVRTELGAYLVERGTDGVRAYSWYHRQFWQTAEERYLFKPFADNKESFNSLAHEAIADYFAGKWQAGKPYTAPKSTKSKLEDRQLPVQPLVFRGNRKAGRQLNGRKLTELPYHLIELKDWKRFLGLTMDLAYLEAKFENDDGYDCLSELITATNGSANKDIQLLTRFVGSNLSFLLHESNSVYQVASQLASSHPVRALVKAIREASLPLPLLRNMAEDDFEDPCEMTLQGHTETIRCCDFSPKGDLIASSADDGTLRVWDTITGAELVTITSLPLPVWPGPEESVTLMLHPVNPCCFSRDGDVIANGTEHGDVMLWDKSGAQLQVRNTVDNPVTFIQFSPDDTILATSFKNSNVMIWAARTLEHMTTVRVGRETTGLCFSPDGKALAVACINGLAVVDTATYSIRAIGQSQSSLVLCCTVHPNNKQVMTGADDSCVGVWDLANVQQVDRLRRHKAWIWSIKFTSDGKTMFTCSSDRSFKVWRFEGGWEVVSTIGGHSHRVSMASIKPGTEDKLVTSSLDRSLKLWDMSAILAGKVPPVGGLHYNVCAYDTSGYLATSQGWQTTCVVSNVITQENLGTSPGHPGFAHTAHFIQNGSKLVTLDTGHCGDYGVDAVKNAKLKVTQIPGLSGVCQLDVYAPTCFSCDDVIAVGTLDGSIILYDTESLEMIRKWNSGDNVKSIARSGAVNMVAAGSGKVCRIWNTSDEKATLVKGLEEHDTAIYVSAFPNNGSFLAVGCDSGKIYIWDVSTGDVPLMKVLDLHTAYIKNIKFSPEGNYMLSCGDLSLRIWDVNDDLSLKCAYYGPVNCAAFKTENVVLAGEASGNLKCLTFKENHSQAEAESLTVKQTKPAQRRTRAQMKHDW